MTRRMNNRRRMPWRRLIPLICLAFWFASMGLSVQAATAAAPQIYSGFSIATNAITGTAVDTGSRGVLYDLDRQQQLPLTLASRLMLLLLVSESFDAGQMVTVSSEVAAIDEAYPTEDQLTLMTGQRVTVEYLTLRFLYYDSHSAIVALTELFNRSIDQMIALMETRARSLELAATTFTQKPDSRSTVYEWLPYSPFTSAEDLMRIQLAILNNAQGYAYLSRGDAYLQVDAGGRRIVSLRSPLTEYRVLSEDKISAAYRASDDQYTLEMVFGITADGIETACLLVLPGGEATDGITALFSGIESFYTRSRLVSRGDVVPSLQETAENGVTFGLVYLDNVSYTHPRNDTFLKETISYQGNPPYRLPLQTGVATGQVIFELRNGFRITASVGPDRAILSDNSTYARLLMAMQNNRNLTAILIGTVGLLFLFLLFGTARNVARALYYRRLGPKR